MFGHSLRSRKIGVDIPMLINHGEIPDIELETPSWREFSAVSTGMEPEEEQETHLKQALQSNSAEAAIPVPDIKIVDGWDEEIDPFPFWQPPTWYIRYSDSEADTSPIEYDMDEDDLKFLQNNRTLRLYNVTETEFEYIIDTMEKHQCGKARMAVPSATVFDVDELPKIFVTKRMRSISPVVWDYWKEKRRKSNILRRFTPWSTKGAFAAFVNRPGPRNERRRKMGRDLDISDDATSLVVLEQFRSQSLVLRDMLERIVFREYRSRQVISENIEILNAASAVGKASYGPIRIVDPVPAAEPSPPPQAPKFKVVFKVNNTTRPVAPVPPPSLEYAELSPNTPAPAPEPVPETPITFAEPKPKKVKAESESSERKKRPSSTPRPSKRTPAPKKTPRVIFAPVDETLSDDDIQMFGDGSDSDEIELPSNWPRALQEDEGSDCDDLEPDYCINPQNYLRPAISDEDYALSRFADLYGRQTSVVKTDDFSLILPHDPLPEVVTLERPSIPTFRGRRRVGRGGRVIWDRFSIQTDLQKEPKLRPLYRLDLPPPKRIKLDDGVDRMDVVDDLQQEAVPAEIVDELATFSATLDRVPLIYEPAKLPAPEEAAPSANAMEERLDTPPEEILEPHETLTPSKDQIPLQPTSLSSSTEIQPAAAATPSSSSSGSPPAQPTSVAQAPSSTSINNLDQSSSQYDSTDDVILISGAGSNFFSHYYSPLNASQDMGSLPPGLFPENHTIPVSSYSHHSSNSVYFGGHLAPLSFDSSRNAYHQTNSK